MSARAVAEPALPESVIRAASEWFVRLGAEEAGAADEAAWRDWLAADARHRRAWERVEALGRQFGQVQARAGLAALERPASGGRRQREDFQGAAAGTGGLAAAGLPWRAWTADLSAGIGQTRVATLDDGSLLTLNTDSAADVRFSDALRLIVLRQGELHIATHRDAMTPARPLAVDTPMGRVFALGTRYSVRLHDDRVRVAVNEGAVRIEPAVAGAAGARRVEAGEGAWFDARAVQPSGPAPHEDAWLQGALYADNMRLDAFIAELGRYRRGRLACDPAVAGLRISGSFPLADTDRALAAVERALPVQVLRYTRYWVVLRGRA
ncbi:FecR domain-containing protein [Achromobacter sp. Marseille-Q0513]|uniref:FecR domain-containing protein n=1 Tax=Achromobacter sp. Marseille-Q0513 TaxID=2829161 RepID=UPI001B97A545|nr:FecR domain-containing protein [Achromobacter sp. Marseille-Q0513]